MKVLFVPVTYNSYDALESYIASVGKALEAAADPTIEVKIHVADNSTSQKADAHNCQLSIVNYQLSNYPNPGYLPAALKTVYSEDYASYDYIIISNVDVVLDETFFTALRDLKADPDTVWVAPYIWSPSEQRDVNPKIQERYTKKRLRLLRLLFACPPLYYLYTRTLYRTRKANQGKDHGDRFLIGSKTTIMQPVPMIPIYAGHGSFMIFRPEIFQQEPKLDYPVFLFCEEIFMAEMARRIGKKVTHCPSVKVWDKEHASTGLMGLWRYCKYNHDALSYIIRTFYE
jgi:GT2 family glycosyltransferase